MSYTLYHSGTLDTPRNVASKATIHLKHAIDATTKDPYDSSESVESDESTDFSDKLTQYLEEEDSIYIYDLTKLKNLYKEWKTLFPFIKPHYAVKCNPDIEILKTLAASGASFDCASPAEIESVLNLKVAPRRIIYANPCKRNQDIAFAAERGIQYTTFDTLCELEKIHKIAPEMKLIMRFYANDPTAQCILSNKFGAFRNEWEPILTRARELNMTIVGVSFHVGSGACNPDAFMDAIIQARELFDIASEKYGYSMNILDIGGGFSLQNVEAMSQSIHNAIDKHFPKEQFSNLRCIAEPGRYFAETIAVLFTKIIGLREREDTIDYWITDSLYGSFNCILYDHIHLHPEPMNLDNEGAICEMKSTLWGPTCDGFDKIIDNYMFPKMSCGDWIEWKNMGAYTIAGACDFNGIALTQPKKLYVY
jgi:ornithine decarboxylase